MTHSKPGAGRLGRALVMAVLVVLGFGLLAAGPGCGREPAESTRLARRTITVDEVPEVPMEAAREALPQITFDEAWQNLDAEGQLQSFEIRGQNDEGKIREVRVSPSGEILEME